MGNNVEMVIIEDRNINDQMVPAYALEVVLNNWDREEKLTPKKVSELLCIEDICIEDWDMATIMLLIVLAQHTKALNFQFKVADVSGYHEIIILPESEYENTGDEETFVFATNIEELDKYLELNVEFGNECCCEEGETDEE